MPNSINAVVERAYRFPNKKKVDLLGEDIFTVCINCVYGEKLSNNSFSFADLGSQQIYTVAYFTNVVAF